MRVLAIANCGDTVSKCMSDVAQSNVGTTPDRIALIETALFERFNGELGGVSIVLIVGILTALIALAKSWQKASSTPLRTKDLKDKPLVRVGLEPANALSIWAIGGTIGLIGLGSFIGYMQPYHMRIATAPITVLAAIGVARLPAVSWAGIGLILFLWWSPEGGSTNGLVTDFNAAAVHDNIAAEMGKTQTPIRVDHVWFDGPMTMESSAVVLSAVLSGQDPNRFQLRHDVPVVLLVNGGPDLNGSHAATYLNQLDAQQWISKWPSAPIQIGGAFDWDSSLNPDQADLSRASW